MLKEIKIGDRLVLFGKLYRILIKHRGLILMIEMDGPFRFSQSG